MTLHGKAKKREWKPGADYRVICSCQRHARARNSWRRALRLASRGVAVLVGVPLALAAFDIPTEAMNLDVILRPAPQSSTVVAPARALVPSETPPDGMPIFTAAAVREQFLDTTTIQKAVSIDSFKEQYFRKYVPYGAIIYREARRNKLPPELVAAMVHTESDFRPSLVSQKSAQGLMQIIPDTARDLGLSNVFDPEQNIAAGTRYYRYLRNRFASDRIALAAYNAGEGHVERCGCVPPFAETQDYIAKVNVRASRYRQRVRNGYLAALRMQPSAIH